MPRYSTITDDDSPQSLRLPPIPRGVRRGTLLARPRELGAIDRRNGLSRLQCPYGARTAAAKRWGMGFDEGSES